MSADALARVIELDATELRDRDFRVLAQMAFRADDEGILRIGVDELALATSRNRKPCEEALRRLWGGRYIVVVEEGGHGRGRKNVYRVQV